MTANCHSFLFQYKQQYLGPDFVCNTTMRDVSESDKVYYILLQLIAVISDGNE